VRQLAQPQLAPIAGVIALFASGFLRALARVPLLPAGDRSAPAEGPGIVA